MARIEGLPNNKAGLLTRFTYWYTRRRFGKVPEPLTLVAHHSWISKGYGMFEWTLGQAKLVEPGLKSLASLKVATLVGCPF
jgi:hypothetical protein